MNSELKQRVCGERMFGHAAAGTKDGTSGNTARAGTCSMKEKAVAECCQVRKEDGVGSWKMVSWLARIRFSSPQALIENRRRIMLEPLCQKVKTPFVDSNHQGR